MDEEENKVEKKRKKKVVDEKKLEEKYEYYGVFPNNFLIEYNNLKKKIIYIYIWRNLVYLKMILI